MLGAGSKAPHRVLVTPDSAPEAETEWVTLDISPENNPNVVFDLDCLSRSVFSPENRLPFPDGHFDEIHAYEVLEHFGRQGDWRGFFAEWAEFYRVLKPQGVLLGSCPTGTSPWCWGDPGHTRYIGPEPLAFLTEQFYTQLGVTPASDYRAFIAPRWWKQVYSSESTHTYRFAMQKA